MLFCTRTNNQCPHAKVGEQGVWCYSKGATACGQLGSHSEALGCFTCKSCGAENIRYVEGLNSLEHKLCWRCCSDGTKHDDGKRKWHLLPFDALEEVVKVLEFGANKYSENNWQNVEPASRYKDAAMRHLIAYISNETKDKETGLSHAAHLACCALFLIWKELKADDDKAGS